MDRLTLIGVCQFGDWWWLYSTRGLASVVAEEMKEKPVIAGMNINYLRLHLARRTMGSI